MRQRLPARPGWQFFAALPRTDGVLAAAWWGLLVLSGVLPAAFAVATGVMVGAVQRGESLIDPSFWSGSPSSGCWGGSVPIQAAAYR